MRRSFLTRLRSGERGAVSTIFAVLLMGGVVMGMLALTVDVGNAWSERRQLQNGADATALALASDCAAGREQECTTNPVASLTPLAGRNADDGRSDVKVCYRSGGSFSFAGPTCPEGAYEQLTLCTPTPDWLTPDFPYVETVSRTRSADGNTTILPKFFSQLLLGGPGDDVSVEACARATWGPPTSYTGTIPFVLSACEWQGFMDTNGDGQVNDSDLGYHIKPADGVKPGYGGSGQPPWPDANREQVMYIFDGADATNCDYLNKDTAGGFGWVQSDDCQATVTTDGWVQISTGKAPANPCKTILEGLRGSVVAIPVFDCMVKDPSAEPSGPISNYACSPDGAGGAKTYYHIKGWAQFFVSGYNMPSMSEASYLSGVVPCSNPSACISGWFVEGALSGAPGGTIGSPGGSGDFGSYMVVPAG
ncbi:TadE/TadG family type IV pilus assembly protein [Intrasporangium sp. DVR]|uniref:TadE/TadG family type IV pilus assembly protein n=1 Tax=Intrasporangium sp. DVR TaxID=3127867 RepID=UPI00313A54C6